MPPKTRRSRGAAAAAGSQSTLSFKNKVTKSSTPNQADGKSKSKTRLSDSAREELVETISTPDPVPATIDPETETEPEQTQQQPSEQQATSPTPRKKKRISAASSSAAIDPREAAAEKITDAQISKWWKQEEKERKAPRVHQELVPLHEKVLRHFDLSGQYGSCIGITRLDRWKRANGLGLEPPVEVLAVLLREAEGGMGKSGGGGGGKKGAGGAQGCGTLAYIDELTAGRVGIVDA